MWCWFKGWRGWLPLLRFSGAPVFLPVQREKGWRAEQHGPTYRRPADGTAWGRPCSKGPRTAPAASTRRAQHPPGTRRALVHSSRHWGGSGASQLPQAPHPQGFRLPHLQSTRYKPCQCFRGCQGCPGPSERRSHKRSSTSAQHVRSTGAPCLPLPLGASGSAQEAQTRPPPRAALSP